MHNRLLVPQGRPTAHRRLAELGLLGRRRRGNFADAESVRLRTALIDIGPLFAYFGRYLGTRVDLLPLAACSILKETAVAEAGGASGAPPSKSGIDVEPIPFQTSPIHLWHRGFLDTGEAVVVKTVRTEMVTALEDQIDELPVLEDLHLDELPDIDGVVEDFVVWFERQVDLGREFEGLRRLASEVRNFDALVVPRLWEEHSGRATLVSADPGGRFLVDFSDGDDNTDRARRLCSAWLQQVLLESVVPEGPLEENLRLLDDGRIAVTGGLFTSLGRSSRRGLLGALVATSRGDPDRACDHLLKVSNADLDEADHDRLRVLFRQAEPFRDGGWTESYHGRRLADTLYVQWRLLRREGVDIPAPVVAYVRGLHQIEGCARRLDPEYDAFADAVDDLGVVAAASRLRETFSVRRVRGVMEAAVPVLREMAETVEKAGADRDGESGSSETTRRDGWRPWSEVAGLLLLMVATVVTSQGLRAAGVGGGWMQAVATGLFIVLAAAALWRTTRAWRRE